MLTGADRAGDRHGLLLLTVLLAAAAAADLSRCGIVVVAARHGQPAAGLVAAGLASAALSLAAARGSHRGRGWASWAAVLIGSASRQPRRPLQPASAPRTQCRTRPPPSWGYC
jgi:hypothetical protein